MLLTAGKNEHKYVFDLSETKKCFKVISAIHLIAALVVIYVIALNLNQVMILLL